MANNLRRALQDIDLGANDAPFVLPQEVVRQAAEENRFILVGRPVMPRRQNLRAVVATMPRNWGLEGIVRGRTIEARRFQFVFPSEEAMETVIRRGPWAYADRMLVLQRWTPLMDMALLNFIPFWIQIRGIPLQYMNREVILNIARTIGQYIQMDYNEESGARMEFVRVRINWDVSHPLKFQRNYQFQLGVNTLLKFQYERLRGFCETCGMLTHDTGACVIQNGGPGDGDEDDDSGDDNENVELPQNQGVIIEEINEEAVRGNEAAADAPEEDEPERHNEMLEEDAEDDELWNGTGKRTIFSDELYDENDYYPYPVRQIGTSDYEIGSKRKTWLTDENANGSKYFAGESSGAQDTKRKKTVSPPSDVMGGDTNEAGRTNTPVRGAVGPEPPLPP
ncbi:uncharacterized protein LOC125576956 [Brassica napus]|nr:uncharacterized protein LOC125576956 [Brassica napus]